MERKRVGSIALVWLKDVKKVDADENRKRNDDVSTLEIHSVRVSSLQQSYHPYSWLSCRLFCWLSCRLFRGLLRGFPSRLLGRTERWMQSSNRKGVKRI